MIKKITVQFARLWRLFLCIIFAERVSGTEAGNDKTHYCNKVHNTHWLSLLFDIFRFRFMRTEGHSPSDEGLTAYRYGSARVQIIAVENIRCN